MVMPLGVESGANSAFKRGRSLSDEAAYAEAAIKAPVAAATYLNIIQASPGAL